MPQTEPGLSSTIMLACLIRRAGGSVRLTRDEVERALDASVSADGRRSEWIFDTVSDDDGSAVTVRAIAAPDRQLEGRELADDTVATLLVSFLSCPGCDSATLAARDAYRGREVCAMCGLPPEAVDAVLAARRRSAEVAGGLERPDAQALTG